MLVSIQHRTALAGRPNHQKLSNNDDLVDGDLSGIVRKALITFVVKIHSQRFL